MPRKSPMRRLRTWISRHQIVAGVAAVFLASLLAGGVWYGIRGAQPDRVPLERLFKDYQSYLLGLPGVTSVSIGERHGKRFLLVIVRELTPRIETGIPKTLGDWQVRVKEIPAQSPSPESPEPSPQPTTLPDPENVAVDVRGIVNGLTRVADPEDGVVGWILVEGYPEPGTIADRASVAITDRTAFFRRRGEDLEPVDVSFTYAELYDTAVEVEFEGELGGGDPVQATAAVVVFVTPES